MKKSLKVVGFSLCVLFSTVIVCVFLLISVATESMLTPLKELLCGKNYCWSLAFFVHRDDT